MSLLPNGFLLSFQQEGRQQQKQHSGAAQSNGLGAHFPAGEWFAHLPKAGEARDVTPAASLLRQSACSKRDEIRESAYSVFVRRGRLNTAGEFIYLFFSLSLSGLAYLRRGMFTITESSVCVFVNEVERVRFAKSVFGVAELHIRPFFYIYCSTLVWQGSVRDKNSVVLKYRSRVFRKARCSV